jgi:hypothetical protein
MAKIKINVNDVEDFTAYDGPTPPRGIYTSQVTTAEVAKSKKGDDMLRFTTVIAEPKASEKSKFNGYPTFHHMAFGTGELDWQQRNIKQLVLAFGVNVDAKGNALFDGDVLAKKLDTGKVKCRVVLKAAKASDDYPDADGMEANGILPLKTEEPEEAADEADVEEGDGTEEEADTEEEVEETDEEPDEEEAEEEPDDEDELGARRAELSELSRADLKKVLRANEETKEFKVTTKMTDADLVETILHAEYEFDAEEAVEPPF